MPGLVLAGIGAALLIALSLGPIRIGAATLYVHSMVGASLLVIVGYQTMTTAIAARIFALEEEIGPPAPSLRRIFGLFTLERGLLAGGLITAAGGAVVAKIALEWAAEGFGELDFHRTLRPMIVGATLIAFGIQTVLMSFVYSMLGIQRRRDA